MNDASQFNPQRWSSRVSLPASIALGYGQACDLQNRLTVLAQVPCGWPGQHWMWVALVLRRSDEYM
jgi:hypothetical protein